ncbi:hypothetical protein TNCV_2535501 [Trichonephila clavipes]|nr:hypothetical protein TNCV_2535501 [Trichonephila clavipes]
MFKNCRKEDLWIVALELELIQYTIEDRKKAQEDRKRAEEDRKKEAENRLREKELELELARLNVRVNSDNERTVRLKKVASHISVRAGNDWFRPLELAKEIDLYNTSRGKSLKTLPHVLSRNNPVKNASREYEDLGHMREIKSDGSGVSFYMPHHGVYRPEKSTTKLRTVFNASSPSTSGKSLNSI